MKRRYRLVSESRVPSVQALAKKLEHDEDLLSLVEQEDDEGGGQASGGSIPGDASPWGPLPTETPLMENQRRDREQAGHRQFAGVKIRERPALHQGTEHAKHQQSKRHPRLKSQRFAGIDKNISPLVDVNPEAEINQHNLQLQQQLEKQQRLGLDHSQRSSPAPSR